MAQDLRPGDVVKPESAALMLTPDEINQLAALYQQELGLTSFDLGPLFLYLLCDLLLSGNRLLSPYKNL